MMPHNVFIYRGNGWSLFNNNIKWIMGNYVIPGFVWLIEETIQ